jgi:hypothetical protein
MESIGPTVDMAFVFLGVMLVAVWIAAKYLEYRG